MSAAENVLLRLAEGTRSDPVRLGRYDVIGRLGSGGMGTVYEAIDRERGTRVALKTISVADVSMGVNLKREFRAVADLAHPNIAALYELGSEEGLWFFAMELVDGVHFSKWARGDEHTARTVVASVARVMRTQEVTVDLHGMTTRELVVLDDEPRAANAATPPSRDLASIRHAFAELVRGLSALHSAGLWHGDIKPSNVLVRRDGRVVIVDFGLARQVSETRAEDGPMAGTPMFMAPEQLAGDASGPFSDWHAVGSLLYEVLTGRPPFRGGSLLELYFAKSHDVPPSPRELLPELPEDLSNVCMELLRPEPERRPSGPDLMRIFDRGDSAVERTPRTFFVGRQRELVFLEHGYARVRSGQRTLVHVIGPSGMGKSTVVKRFLRGVSNVDRARVLRGRCYERETVPYKAFDGIVDDLAELLRTMHVSQSEALVPEYVGELGSVFPALMSAPAFAVRAQLATLALDAREVRRRAWRALTDVFLGLAKHKPVVLAIDDLQWADADSVALLDAVVAGTASGRVLVVASFRPEEAANNALLESHFAECRALEREGSFVALHLSALPAHDAEKLAGTMLESLGAPTRDETVKLLAAEARGVPFFIEELARYAAQHGFGDVSLDRAVAARVRGLPPEQRAIIEVVAVADTPIPQSLVFEAAALDAGALSALLALRSASMLGWAGASADDLVSTYHDRIREAVLAQMDPDARAARNLSLGRAIAARHRHDAPGSWVFAAVRHLDAATITDPDERYATARLHLHAGRLARASAAFPLAFRCFEAGLALLPDDAWQSSYDLALGLCSGAADAAYLTADWATFDARIATLKTHAKTTMDQLGAWELQIDAQIGRHEYVAAIETACSVLRLLDFDLPADPDQATVQASFVRALGCLERVGPEGLAALADVDDVRIAAAMRIHIRVSPAAYFGRPMLLPVIASNLIVSSVERGLSSATPYALALFGIVLNTVGMHPAAHQWGQLAVKLIDRFPDRSTEAATRHVVFNLVCTWIPPLHTILEPLREVFDIGRRIGDYEYASYAAHGYVHHALYAGRPLGPLVSEAIALGEQMSALGQVNALHVHEPFVQLLKCLTGAIAEPSRLDDERFDEETLLAQFRAEGSRSGIFIQQFVMGLARYYFGEARDAHACFEIARSYIDAAPSVWHQPILHQLGGLAARAVGDEETLAKSLTALRALAEHSPVNFAHRVKMLEGNYDEALELARAGHWLNDVALIHELAGHREAAREAYAAWGATAKARRL
jgi:predicted ATPase/serine/threonine protein kinase